MCYEFCVKVLEEKNICHSVVRNSLNLSQNVLYIVVLKTRLDD